ncbi:MAG: hypothetical protein ACE5F7_04475 [Nitrospiria bacterium]
MFIGINTNIQHKGETYHVQTEDGGLDRHTLTTILFKDGVILSAKKTSYLDIPKSPSYEKTVKEIMQRQHKQMLRDLVKGVFDSQNGPPRKPQKQAEQNPSQSRSRVEKKGLDGLILDYLAQKEASYV